VVDSTGGHVWHRHAGMGARTADASKAVGPARGSQSALPGVKPGGGRLSLLLWSCGRHPHVVPSASALSGPTARPALPTVWPGCQGLESAHGQGAGHERSQQPATGREQCFFPARRQRGDRRLPAESAAPSATQEPRGRRSQGGAGAKGAQRAGCTTPSTALACAARHADG